MSIGADLIRGHTEAIILSLLREKNSYGYEINKTISQVSGGMSSRKPRSTRPSSAWRMQAISPPTGGSRAPVPGENTMLSPPGAWMPAAGWRKSGKKPGRSSTNC